MWTLHYRLLFYLAIVFDGHGRRLDRHQWASSDLGGLSSGFHLALFEWPLAPVSRWWLSSRRGFLQQQDDNVRDAPENKSRTPETWTSEIVLLESVQGLLCLVLAYGWATRTSLIIQLLTPLRSSMHQLHDYTESIASVHGMAIALRVVSLMLFRSDPVVPLTGVLLRRSCDWPQETIFLFSNDYTAIYCVETDRCDS